MNLIEFLNTTKKTLFTYIFILYQLLRNRYKISETMMVL